MVDKELKIINQQKRHRENITIVRYTRVCRFK